MTGPDMSWPDLTDLCFNTLIQCLTSDSWTEVAVWRPKVRFLDRGRILANFSQFSRQGSRLSACVAFSRQGSYSKHFTAFLRQWSHLSGLGQFSRQGSHFQNMRFLVILSSVFAYFAFTMLMRGVFCVWIREDSVNCHQNINSELLFCTRIFVV